MAIRISRSQRLTAVIGISCSFFLAEIAGMHLVLLFPTREWDCSGPSQRLSCLRLVTRFQPPKQFETSLLVDR